MDERWARERRGGLIASSGSWALYIGGIVRGTWFAGVVVRMFLGSVGLDLVDDVEVFLRLVTGGSKYLCEASEGERGKRICRVI